ncbi:phosphotransferase family protein [Nocardia sp. alder85J]|uniref:phosphotransferase family protein n=1 Tax=Nocardia sp. alder85J TaxID=2862949 RepID=UPI001CD7073F|nr:phosphotransferase family protein [Nocardia sp. alder85J]MCX4096843.1 phosphotransferase family protein [Nocardia sp. alder85J]
MIDLDTGVPAELTAWLRSALPAAEPPFTCRRISGGYSMLTYHLDDATGHHWVLRHPPAGHHAGRAHDTDREARVMTALAGTAVPVPAVVAVGAATDPLGAPCHITEFVAGQVVSDEDAARRLGPDALRTATTDIVTALATLHSIDPDAAGLGDFGPRTGYLERQLHRWRAVIDAAAGGDTADLAAALAGLADLIERNIRPDSAVRVVHGDYRLGNAIVGDDGRVRAVLDWELASLGDPLADLAGLVAFWNPPAAAMLGDRMPTLAPGAIGTDEVVRRYGAETGADLGNLWVYHTFAAWRLACTALRAHARYASGAMKDNSDLTRFTTACAAWIEAANTSAKDQS